MTPPAPGAEPARPDRPGGRGRDEGGLAVLVVGGGGREHALAWKLAASPRVGRVLVAPGNGGTDRRAAAVRGSETARIANVPVAETDAAGLIDLARRERVALAVIGPEAPLAAGLADAFRAAGLACFGPSRAAAQIEASKAFAKRFMLRHRIPTARAEIFRDHAAARAHLSAVDYPVVIKASGLAAGKGVIVPADRSAAAAALDSIMAERAFGAAGDEVLIEERLAGRELSILAFCDGRDFALMPAAQDHKPAYDGDHGPNTGGMGAYAPAPLATPALLAETAERVIGPALAGLASEGLPYAGVLYAGLMIGAHGLSVLEFNCRFGDPETQVILPLLASDLADLLLACAAGGLAGSPPVWRAGAAATVVAASGGYPGNYSKGLEITGVANAAAVPGVTVFHAGTRWTADDKLATSGGRVLAVTGVAADLRQAIDRAYTGISRIRFEGMHFRRDIGARAFAPPA